VDVEGTTGKDPFHVPSGELFNLRSWVYMTNGIPLLSFRMSWLRGIIRSVITRVWNERISIKSRDSVPTRDWLAEYSDLGIYDSEMEQIETFEKCLEVNGELVASTVIRDNGGLKPTAKSKIDPYVSLGL
jgi:hypothetical protein